MTIDQANVLLARMDEISESLRNIANVLTWIDNHGLRIYKPI